MLPVLEICILFLRPRSNRGSSCSKDAENAGSLQKSVVGTWLSHSAFLYFEIQP